MSYISHAKREFKIVKENKKVETAVFKLLKIFSKQGHSGGSAPYAANIFRVMAKLQNINEVNQKFIDLGYKTNEDSDDIDNWIQEGTLELLNEFYKQKLSDKDKKLVIKYFYKISMFKPLAPIMCTDDEWNDVSIPSDEEEIYQNNRCGAVFKHGKNGKPYYLDAIIWKNQEGITYTGSSFNSKKEKITSSQTIKIPFKPKSFYIDRIDYEIAPDDWESFIKDDSQLKEVWEYYEHQETPSYIRLKKLQEINVL